MPIIGIQTLYKQKYSIAAASLTVALLAMALSPLANTVSADAIAATDHSRSVSTGEVRQALQYTSGVLSDSSTTATTSDNDSALVAATAGATIDVPKNASEGVTLSNPNGPSLDIALPNASQSGSGQQVAPGVIAYPSNDGSANAVQATEDGSVRMLTVIDNPNAPTTYDYKVTVPEGGTIQITEDGGAVVQDVNGQVLASVAAPWAKDARGRQIRTWFTTDGTTLTQHVKHNVRGVVYPVTADPAWFVVAGGIIAWAAGTCATSVLAGVGLDGTRWAIQRGDWYWNKKLDDALWNCGWGIATGGILRFAPASVKSWTASQIKDLARALLKWRI